MSNVLVILIAYLLVMAMLAIGVVGLHPGSVRPMIRAPRQFLRLLFSRRLRQNHALEHATINVLKQHYPRTHAVGMPAENGFHIRGRVSPEVIISSTQEAIRRLKNGERSLAWSRRCPTSLIASQLVLSIILLGAVFAFWREFTALPLLIGLLGGALLGPPVSPYLQRLLLVDPNPETLEFRDLEFEQPSSRIGMLSFLVYQPMFVRVAAVGEKNRSSSGDVTLITGAQEEIPAGNYRYRE